MVLRPIFRVARFSRTDQSILVARALKIGLRSRHAVFSEWLEGLQLSLLAV
jgi:hypothetical protein